MYQKSCIAFLIVPILFLGVSFCSAAGSLPTPGEQLRYSVNWEGFSVGEVIFDSMPIATLDNKAAYHFSMRAETSPVLDAVLGIADRIDSYVDTGMTHAFLYKERKSTTMEHDATITFDWQKNEAQYCLNGKKFKPTALMPGAFDALSVLYALRLLDLNGKKEISRPVSNGFQCVILRAKVLGKQKVRVASGEYTAFVLEPQLAEFPALFDTLSAATVKLWISADERRLPVKIECNFSLGRLTAELNGVKPGK